MLVVYPDDRVMGALDHHFREATKICCRARTVRRSSCRPGVCRSAHHIVRVLGLQGAGGELGMFGIEVDVSAELAVEEALRVALSIKDAAERIADTNKQ